MFAAELDVFERGIQGIAHHFGQIHQQVDLSARAQLPFDFRFKALEIDHLERTEDADHGEAVFMLDGDHDLFRKVKGMHGERPRYPPWKGSDSSIPPTPAFPSTMRPPSVTIDPAMSDTPDSSEFAFADLGLPVALLKALNDVGYETP